MDIHVDDDGFIRAPAPAVYRHLTDIGRWGRWWPGVRTWRLDDPAGVEVYAWEVRAWPWRRLRTVATPHGWRHDVGFHLRLEGDLDGDAEFWLEPGWGGTVVHHLLHARVRRGDPQRILRDYRWVLRRGLWAAKDAVQAAVRAEAGLRP